MALYQIEVTALEPSIGTVQIEADSEEEAMLMTVNIMEGEGFVNVQLGRVHLLADTAEYNAFKKSLN